MATKVTRYSAKLEDVNDSFARFVREAPKKAKGYLSTAVFVTTARVLVRMESLVPVGPDAPHIKDDLAFDHRGLRGRAGILKSEGEDGPAHVALYQEYGTKRHGAQPFMRPAAMASKADFVKEATDALNRCARDLALR